MVPQLELLENRLQPSTLLPGQDWTLWAADDLLADPAQGAFPSSPTHPFLGASGPELKPLSAQAATALFSGSSQGSGASGAAAQPTAPAPTLPNGTPSLASDLPALVTPPHQQESSGGAAFRNVLKPALPAHALTQIQATLPLVSVRTELTPAPTHVAQQQIHTQASQNWATYVTGTPTIATSRAVVTDASGNIYVTGSTDEGTVKKGFVAAYDPTGVQLFFSTFQAKDLTVAPTLNYTKTEPHALALDGNGNIYVTGQATNPTTRFQDAFILRMDNSGNVDPNYGIGFEATDILGRPIGNSVGNGIVVTPAGIATITGTARFGANDIFVAQVGPDNSVPNLDLFHAYAFALDPRSFTDQTGQQVFNATAGSAIALDPTGAVAYLSGTGTHSGGDSDILIMSMNVQAPLIFDPNNFLAPPQLDGGYSYVQNPGNDVGNGLVVGPDGSVFQAATAAVQGSTFAAAINWTAGLLQGAYGVYDQVSSTMTGTGIDVDPSGNAYLTGTAPDVFAVPRALVDQLDPTGAISDTLLLADNGSGQEAGNGIAYSDVDGAVFVTGITTSSNLSTDTTGLNGQQDGFLASVGNFGQ